MRAQLSEQLIKLRMEKGWTQLEAAEILGLRLIKIQNIEMTRFRSIDSVIHIASLYGKKVHINLV